MEGLQPPLHDIEDSPLNRNREFGIDATPTESPSTTGSRWTRWQWAKNRCITYLGIPLLVGAALGLALAALGADIGTFGEWVPRLGSAEIGTVGEWVSGLGTLAALLAVIWQVGRQERGEEDRLQRVIASEHERLLTELEALAQQEHLRDLAKVHAWASIDWFESNDDARARAGFPPGKKPWFTIRQLNGSSQPIFYPKVYYQLGEFDFRTEVECSQGPLEPELASGCLVSNDYWVQQIPRALSAEHVALELHFSDAQGTRWIRRSNGRLDQVLADPPGGDLYPPPAQFL